jgi:hypothetical protein
MDNENLPVMENALYEVPVEKEKDLQLTDEWFKDKLGKFSGSNMKKLMSCKSRAKREWTSREKLIDFGDTALTYMIEVALERVTGERIEIPQTYAMSRGIDLEQDAKNYFVQNWDKSDFATKFSSFELIELGFERFLSNAGASLDAKLILVDGKQTAVAFENKCPENVRIHMTQCQHGVDESHQYFWQLHSEMLAIKSDLGILVSFDPRFPEGSMLKTIKVELSQNHSVAMQFRLVLAEMFISRLIETNFDMDIYAELAGIVSVVPKDFAEMQEWLLVNVKDLYL